MKYGKLGTDFFLNQAEILYYFRNIRSRKTASRKLRSQLLRPSRKNLEKFTTPNSPHSISAFSYDESEWIKCGKENNDNGEIKNRLSVVNFYKFFRKGHNK